MKHKAQISLNSLYSLRNGVKNNYPFVDRIMESKYDENAGIARFIDKDKETVQQLIDNALTVDLISLNIEIICEQMYRFRNLKKRRKDDSFDEIILKCQKIITCLNKQKEMWEEE